MSTAEDIDRPPAGTACATCRAMGHFCAARCFKGQTDIGLCEPCLNEENCPFITALNVKNIEAFIPDPGVASAPGRVIPPEEWAPTEAIKQSTTEIQDLYQTEPDGRSAARLYLNTKRGPTKDEDADMEIETQAEAEPIQNLPSDDLSEETIQPEEPRVAAPVPQPSQIVRQKTDSIQRAFLKRTFTNVIKFLDSLSEFGITGLKHAASVAPTTSWFIEEKVGEDWHIVLNHPVFYGDRAEARRIARHLSKSGKDTQTLMWSKGVTPQIVHLPEEPTAESPKAAILPEALEHNRIGLATKTEERENAKILLRQGMSVRKVAHAVGLSDATVLKVRRELGLVGQPKPDKAVKSAQGWEPSKFPVTLPDSPIESHEAEPETIAEEHPEMVYETAPVISRPATTTMTVTVHQSPYYAVIADLEQRIAKMQQVVDCLKALIA